MDKQSRVMIDQQETIGFLFQGQAHQELQLDNQFEVESTKSLLREQFRMYNQQLSMMGLLQFGDLFNNNNYEIGVSLRANQSNVKKFIQEQELQDRQQVVIKQMEQTVDNLRVIRSKLQIDLQELKSRQQVSDKAHKDLQELLSQLKAQLESKDLENFKLKDHVQKNQLKSISYINSIYGEKIDEDGALLFTVDVDEEYSSMAAKQYQELYLKL